MREESRKLSWIAPLAAILISFLFMLPFIRGNYLSLNSEFNMYQSYLRTFIETLKRGELPLWNEFVASGHPSIYFGHYPINYTTLIYALFGYSDQSYGWMRFINMAILMLVYFYSGRRLGFSRTESLMGGLVYFGINFVIRVLVSETVASVTTLLPPVFIFIYLIVRSQFSSRRDCFMYFVFFYIWASGSPVTYLFMPAAMLCLCYLIAAFLYRTPQRLICRYFLVLVLLPFAAVAYQVYLTYDVVSASNRLEPGLLTSPLAAEPWRQFFRSLRSSTYLWFLLFYGIAVIKNFVSLRIIALFLSVLALFLTQRSHPELEALTDYLPLLSSCVFWIPAAFWAYSLIVFSPRSERPYLTGCFLLMTSLISYFLYMPKNIQGGAEIGYDFALYQELGLSTQILLNSLMFFSVFSWRKSKLAQWSVLSLLALYFMRSHLSILLLRWAGIIWYATRDGPIFSLFFSILILIGMQVWAKRFARYRNNWVTGLGILAGVLIFVSSYQKMYHGESHRYAWPVKEDIVKTPTEKTYFSMYKSKVLLRQKLTDIAHSESGFYRFFTPSLTEGYIAGATQDIGIHEAAHYDSTPSRDLVNFYQQVLLGKPEERHQELKYLLPYAQFTKHFHAGIGLAASEIPYRGFYLYSPDQERLLRHESIEFWWDIAQVKYLVVESTFLRSILQFSNAADYHVEESFPVLDLSIVKRNRPLLKSGLAFVPIGDAETAASVIEKLNAVSVGSLKDSLASMQFILAGDSFSMQKLRASNSQISYQLKAPMHGILVDFESWNKNWQALDNGQPTNLNKVFHIYRGIEVQAGSNRIELEYRPRFLSIFLVLAILTPVIFLLLILTLVPRIPSLYIGPELPSKPTS